MRDFAPMTQRERTLYHLERTLIHRNFPGLTAREVAVVDAVDFDGRPKEPRLQLSRAAAEGSSADASALMTHLLIHYEMKDSGQPQWRGHGPYFARRALELGVCSDAVGRRCFSIADWLDDPSLRSGRHAVHARGIDVVFGLARAYRDELTDFFMNERWLRGGHRLPENLLPFVKFYSEEITDLLAVGVTVRRLTEQSGGD